MAAAAPVENKQQALILANEDVRNLNMSQLRRLGGRVGTSQLNHPFQDEI
jgi:hypothetical protein